MLLENQMTYSCLSSLDFFKESDAHQLVLDYVQETSSMSGPKIQLPYNWLVTEREEVENSQARSKEMYLSNMGL